MVGLIPDFSAQMTWYSHMMEEDKLHLSFYDYGVAFLTSIYTYLSHYVVSAI